MCKWNVPFSELLNCDLRKIMQENWLYVIDSNYFINKSNKVKQSTNDFSLLTV